MPSRLGEVVTRLARKTVANEINWKRTETEGVFQHALPNYTLRFSEEDIEGQTSPDYVLTIYNQDGEVIEEVGDPELARHEDVDDAFNIMREAYEAARRQAMGIDKALDELMNYLNDE